MRIIKKIYYDSQKIPLHKMRDVFQSLMGFYLLGIYFYVYDFAYHVTISFLDSVYVFSFLFLLEYGIQTTLPFYYWQNIYINLQMVNNTCNI